MYQAKEDSPGMRKVYAKLWQSESIVYGANSMARLDRTRLEAGRELK